MPEQGMGVAGQLLSPPECSCCYPAIDVLSGFGKTSLHSICLRGTMCIKTSGSQNSCTHTLRKLQTFVGDLKTASSIPGITQGIVVLC